MYRKKNIYTEKNHALKEFGILKTRHVNVKILLSLYNTWDAQNIPLGHYALFLDMYEWSKSRVYPIVESPDTICTNDTIQLGEVDSSCWWSIVRDIIKSNQLDFP